MSVSVAMDPKETVKEIRVFTEAMIAEGLSDAQNLPATSGSVTGLFEVTVSNAEALTIALKNRPYPEIYRELNNAGCYNVRLLDGGLVVMRYRFVEGVVAAHSLSYWPSPDLSPYQETPDLYAEDPVFSEVVLVRVVPVPLRFDFSSDVGSFEAHFHSRSHLTIGQYKNCRIPVCSPVGPLRFGHFVLRHFYCRAYRQMSSDLPPPGAMPRTIENDEARWTHMALGS